MSKRVLIGVLGGLIVASFAPTSAQAGSYPVVACLSDAGRFRTHAFAEFHTPGMSVKRKCQPGVQGTRGLYVGNTVRGRGVPRNSRAVATLNPPPGMSFVNLNWTGSARRTDCRYEIEMSAIGPNVGERLIKILAGKKCPKRNRAQVAGRRVRGQGPRNIRGANQIVLRVICRARSGKRCSARKSNFARLGVVSATVEDSTPPAVSITGGELVSGRWVRGEQPVSYTASDGAGVSRGVGCCLAALTRVAKAIRVTARCPFPAPTGPTRSTPAHGPGPRRDPRSSRGRCDRCRGQ